MSRIGLQSNNTGSDGDFVGLLSSRFVLIINLYAFFLRNLTLYVHEMY